MANSYYKNCSTIALNEDLELNRYLVARDRIDHEESHICGYCLEEMATGEDECCDLCRKSLKEMEK